MTDSEKIQELEKRLAAIEKGKRQKRWLWIAFALLVPTVLFAAAITKPHTFTDGDTLSAGKLNENFDTLYTKVNELEAWKTTEETKGKSWRLIYETDVTSATQTVSATGLDGNTDLEYQVRLRIAGGGTGGLYIRPNNDASTANYGTQDIYGSGTGAAAMSRDTAAQGMFCGGINAGAYSSCVLEFIAKSGAPRFALALLAENVTSTTIGYNRTVGAVWTNTGTNITSMTIYSTIAGGIGAGSHIEIWARR